MLNTLLIILPLLIPVLVLGQLFTRLFSRQPDKYERIHHTFSYAHPAFTHGGQRPPMSYPEQVAGE